MGTAGVMLQLQVLLVLAVLSTGELAQVEFSKWSEAEYDTEVGHTDARQLLQTTPTAFPTPAIPPTSAPTTTPTGSPTKSPTEAPTTTPFVYCGQLEMRHHEISGYNGVYDVIPNKLCDNKATYTCRDCTADIIVFWHSLGFWVLKNASAPPSGCNGAFTAKASTNTDTPMPTLDYEITWTPCTSCDGTTNTYTTAYSEYVGFRPVHRTCYYGDPSTIQQTKEFNECYSSLSSCADLDLRGKGLSGTIPTEIGELTALTSVNLTGNKLNGLLPTELGELTLLTRLEAAGNCDDEYDCFDVANNNAFNSALPSQMGAMTALARLIMPGAQIKGLIPSELADCPLEVLTLHNNAITGPIPGGLFKDGALTSALTSLDLSANRLMQIPTELGQATSLTSLKLNSEALTGSIPTQIGALAALVQLEIYDNPGLSGVMPSEIGSLSQLTQLSLDGNNLTGPIPTEIFSLSLLETLELYDNPLDGTLPAEVSSLAALTEMDITGTKLTGSIPTEIGLLNLTLEDLALELSGEVPDQLFSLTKLISLELRGISGTIPAQLSLPAALTKFHINNADIEGTIPDVFSSLAGLKQVGITNCPKITGKLPEKLIDDGQSSTLEEILFHWNNLTGTIPTSYATSYTGLVKVSLGDNKLTGTIPTFMSSLLEEFDVVGNELTGSIPDTMPFADMANLKIFRVSANRLCGTATSIPSALQTKIASGVEYMDNGNRIGALCPMTWACCSELHQISTFCCLADKLETDTYLDDESKWKVCRNSC